MLPYFYGLFMRLREFAPSPGSNGGDNGDFAMTWNQIVDRFRQVLTHNLGWRMEAGPGRTANFSKGEMNFIINQYESPRQIYYYINDGTRQWKGFKFTMWNSITQLLDTVRSLPLKEFAPGPDGDDEGDIPRPVHNLANRWWNAADPADQKRIADVLRGMGWSIAQVESEDDAVELQHTDGTTEFISADEFDPDL